MSKQIMSIDEALAKGVLVVRYPEKEFYAAKGWEGRVVWREFFNFMVLEVDMPDDTADQNHSLQA